MFHDKYIDLLKVHYKEGGGHASFAVKHHLNPSTVCNWAIVAGLQKQTKRHSPDGPSHDILQRLRKHLRTGNDCNTFAEQIGVDKATVSRWAVMAGCRFETKWVFVKPLWSKHSKKLVRALKSGSTPFEYAKKHNLPDHTVRKWATQLGWTWHGKWSVPVEDTTP